MVPAPMLTRAPTCASPTYARWFAFEPAPSSEFFTSTKLPMCTPPEREALGRKRANGPMLQLGPMRSEEHTSELQSQSNLVCRLLLEKKHIKTSTCPRSSNSQNKTRSIAPDL